jgi:LmbE family N-acetylglucosaminyl deacetylase
MLRLAANTLRRTIRARQWSDCYPILLPHARSLPDLPPGLFLCDGTRRLTEIASQCTLGRRELIRCHDQNYLLIWPGALNRRPIRSEQLVSDVGRAIRPAVIIVSPHPDDAALSVGGMILLATMNLPAFAPGQFASWIGNHSDAQDILLLDIFSRTAWTRLPGVTDPGAITSLRLAEERLAARLMRICLYLLDLPEALLRGHTMGDVFTAAPHQQDQLAAHLIEQEIIGLASTHPHARWLLPLGAGQHLDHRLSRDAALAALARAAIPRAQIAFYEDLPYAAAGDSDFSHFLPDRQLTSAPINITPTLRWKLELLRVYHSQFTWPQILQLKAYAHRQGAVAMECLWR